jgi:hypothetical protein
MIVQYHISYTNKVAHNKLEKTGKVRYLSISTLKYEDVL